MQPRQIPEAPRDEYRQPAAGTVRDRRNAGNVHLDAERHAQGATGRRHQTGQESVRQGRGAQRHQQAVDQVGLGSAEGLSG